MSDIPFALADEDLEDAFPPSYLERGIRYFRNGRVLTADYNAAQELVSGRVRGSGGTGLSVRRAAPAGRWR